MVTIGGLPGASPRPTVQNHTHLSVAMRAALVRYCAGDCTCVLYVTGSQRATFDALVRRGYLGEGEGVYILTSAGARARRALASANDVRTCRPASERPANHQKKS